MSFNVGNNSANYLSTTGVVASYPFAVHLWAKANTSTATQMLWASQLNSNNFVYLSANSGNTLTWQMAASGSFSSATTSNTFTDGAWFSALMVGISATERRLYLNGAGEGLSTTSRAISGYTASQIAKSINIDSSLSLNGQIGDVCVWKNFTGNPFTLDIRQALAFGISPLLLTKIVQDIVSYLPLFNDSQGMIGPDYAENGTVTWSPLHPTIYFPRTSVSPPPGPMHAEDTIVLTESVTLDGSFNRDVSDTISVTEDADYHFDETVSDTIALAEDVLPGKSARDTIALTESITIDMSYLRPASDTISLLETIRRFGVAEDTISLVETVTLVRLAEDTISLTEILFNDDRIDVVDIVTLSDTSGQPVAGSDTIAVVEAITLVRAGQRDGSNEIVLYESASYILNADCPTCCDVTERYSPFVGANSDPDAPDPPSTTAPTLTASHSIVLSHPFNSPTLNVTLRAPVFGNRDRLTNQRITRESRGGTLLIYADPQWPKVHTLVMDFAVVSEVTAQDYMDFLAATLGKEIRLVDHESRNWRGVLIQPDEPITRNKRCDLSASLIFEGELV